MLVVKRGWILLGATMLLAAGALGKPNVILVLTDGQGDGLSSANPNPVFTTAKMDAFRNSAVRLEQFLLSPGSAATRAALLTGQHEFAVGVSHTRMGRSLLAPGVASLPEVLRGAGYATAIFGNWHLGENFPCRPQDRGFGEVLIHGGGGIGQTPDRWGNTCQSPVLKHNGAWQPYTGDATDIFFREATSWMEQQVKEKQPFFLYLATNAADAPFVALMASLEASGVAQDTMVILISANGSAMGACSIRWPAKLEPRSINDMAAHVDLLPTLAAWCGASLPDGWIGEGVDLSAALGAKQPLPQDRVVVTHAGGWPASESPVQHRFRNYSVRSRGFRMVGLNLFDLAADPAEERNVFADHPEVVARLTNAYGAWWKKVAPVLQQPVRYIIGADQQTLTELTAHDWWPSRDIDDAKGADAVWNQAQIKQLLADLTTPAQRESHSALTGRWFLDAARDGHYKVTLRLLPAEASVEEGKQLGRLRQGKAHVRVNREEVIVDVLAGASAVSVGIDVDAGALDLEAYFDGQLAGGKQLGALFTTIERVGERRRTLRPEVHPNPQGE